MGESYFLGANSRRGFHSLYRGFATAQGDVLHVIKGGPGTGKSSFMRRIGAAAAARGLDADYVLCSGDPDSLDGVYIPALRQGWVDGTAPHVADASRFGVDGDYIDLGRFCRLPLPENERERARRLYERYRERYAAAYRTLAAAGAVQEAYAARMDAALSAKLERRLEGILKRHTPRGGAGGEALRYLSAISGKGLLRLPLPPGYERICRLEDARGRQPEAVALAARLARQKGLRRILCLSPLDPERPEALLLPEAGLAFLAGEPGVTEGRGLRLDGMAGQPDKDERAALRQGRQLQQLLTERAVQQLRQAKALHDELEAVYRPHMDFAALDDFTEREIARFLP